MKKELYNHINLQLIKELQTPLAGSLEPKDFQKLQIDTVIEFIDLIIEEYENSVKLALDKDGDD